MANVTTSPTNVTEASRLSKRAIKVFYDAELAKRGQRVLFGNASKDEMIHELVEMGSLDPQRGPQ